MLTGCTSLFSVLHAAGSFQCCLLARSCRLPTCSYRFTTQAINTFMQPVNVFLQVHNASLQAINTFMQAANVFLQVHNAFLQVSTRSCRLSTCSCALHSHCTNSRSPKMLCILLVCISYNMPKRYVAGLWTRHPSARGGSVHKPQLTD